MNPIIVALDTDDLHRLGALSAAIGPRVGLLKVGLQAYTAHGPRAVEEAKAHAPVFCDLKLHDIPSTVAGAAAAAADLGVAMLTVHAGGGPEMIAAAVKAAPDVRILAVTVLTSLHDDTLALVGQRPAEEQVVRLAQVAVESGANGIVCSPTEVTRVRAAVGDDVVLVTPGIRPRGAGRDDQARVGEPRAALDAGADYLVVGRPVTGAAEPLAALDALHAEISR